ncbi:MAG TPA: Ig-like domain-containing protein, partial [Marinagarivorans sp.]
MQISYFVRALFPVVALALSACVGNDSVSSSSVATSSSTSAASSSVAAVNAMPEVSFTSPLNGHSFDQGRNALAIEAAASDDDGNLASVSLYINDVLSSSLTQSPYRWPANVLNLLDAGSYDLRLVAEDAQGAKSSDTITVTANAAVNTAPSLEFTFPLDGDVLPFRSSVDVSVDASDSDGQITSVLLLLNNQRLAVLSNPPFKWPSLLLPALQDLNAGLYILRAVATDNRGATTAREVTFEVLVRNDFPTVSFAAPAENLRLPVGSSLDVVANAADTDGNIEEVILSINDQLVGSDYNP